MAEPALHVKKGLLRNCLDWFQVDFRQSIVSLVETHFPNYALPGEVRSVLEHWGQMRQVVEGAPSDSIDLATIFADTPAGGSEKLPLFN
jgi:hypothetical protein